MDTIKFANKRQVALYECEIKGQLSDGHWENAEPSDHWKRMCSAVVTVATGKQKTGCNFIPDIQYCFEDEDLVSIVGDRMMEWVKITTAFPEYRNRTDSHWSWKFSEVEQQQIDKVKYTLKRLKKDLSEMSAIVNS